MCGIIGIQGKDRVESLLVEALAQMEYRGYDSAGIATLSHRGVEVRRAVGNISNLRRALEVAPAAGTSGIGHTRWATHGGPIARNAHPHVVGALSVVHNGVIENVDALRKQLPASLACSDTDTEVIALLLQKVCGEQPLTLPLLREVLAMLQGSYALLILDDRQPDKLFFAKQASPLLLCRSGEGGMRASSDVSAFGELAPLVHVVEDGCAGWIQAHGAHMENAAAEVVHPSFSPVVVDDTTDEKLDEGSTYMAQEIRQQPAVMRALADAFAVEDDFDVEMQFNPLAIDHVHIVACGSSQYASCTVAGDVERSANVLVSVSLASEFRYRRPHLTSRTLVVGVSQSGETADTLAALEHARDAGCPVVVFTNVGHSAMARLGRDSAGCVLLHAGREVCVASTKAFSAQVAALTLFADWLGRRRGGAGTWAAGQMLQAAAADYDANTGHWRTMQTLAASLHAHDDLLLLGRDALYPVAMEGALKIKELVYIRAEGFAAGELKHGPLALVSSGMPVVAVVDDTEPGRKTALALDEVEARGGHVFVIAPDGHDVLQRHPGVGLKASSALSLRLQASCMLQLLALHLAQERGCNVDKPRNLAKSVTVE